MRIIKSILFLVLFASTAFSQVTVQYDTTSIYLSGVEQDTIIISFQDRANKEFNIDTTGHSSEITAVGKRVFIPDAIYVILDTVEVSADANADSSAVYWVPLNPVSKAQMVADSTNLYGTSTVATETLTDGRIFDLSLTRYAGDYALVFRQDDLTEPVVRWLVTFVRKEQWQ